MTRWIEAMLGALFVAASAFEANGQSAGKAVVPDSFDERATRQRADTKQWLDLNQVAWDKPEDHVAAAGALRKAADLVAGQPGLAGKDAKPFRASADAFAAVARLPPDKRQLYLDAFRTRSAATSLLQRGDRANGVLQLQKAQEQLVSAVGEGNILLVYNLFNLTLIEAAIGEFAAGRTHGQELLAIIEREWGKEHGATAHALFHLAKNEIGLRDFDAAEKHLARAIEVFQPVVRDRMSDFYTKMYADVEQHMAQLLNDRKRHAEAEPHAQRAIEVTTFYLKEMYVDFLENQIELARSRSGQGKVLEAELTFKGLLNAIEPNWPPPITVKVLTPYAEHLRSVKQEAEAERVEARIKELARAGGKTPAP